MVAASGEKEGLKPRTAVACFVGVVLTLLALVLLSHKTTLLGRAPLPLPPDALAFKAREMLKGFGYTEEPVDSAYGYLPTFSADAYQRYLRTKDYDHRWERLASYRPPMTGFWYRQHQDYLQPGDFLSAPGLLNNGLVTPWDPPMTGKDMVLVMLDPKGRLAHLRALPSLAPPQAAARPAMDWSSLLSAAGLDATTLTASPPEAFLVMFADSRMAWTGSYAEGRPDTIRVEAAALQGRPVYFKILGQPWQSDEFAATPRGERLTSIFLEVLLVAVLVAAALVAWRNVRLGRGDKKAAWRVAAMVFAAGVASWALAASHVPTLWELYVLFNGLSWAVFQAAFVGLLYLAVEPYVRKHWPDALISWLRIVGGRFRDPLATSHVLVGVTAGLALGLVALATAWATGRFTSETSAVVGLSGTRFFLGILLGQLNGSAWYSTGLVLVMVLLRSVARRTWVADVLFVAILTLPSLSTPTDIPSALLSLVAVVWIIRRFGLLAMVSMGCARSLVQSMPLAGASWYAPLAFATPILVAALAAWSLYVIVTSRPGASSRPVSAAQF